MTIRPSASRGGVLLFVLLFALFIVAVICLSQLVGVRLPFIQARVTAAPGACLNNLRQLDGAKAQIALEYKLTNGTPVRPAQVGLYLKGGVLPQCPEGGSYTLGKIGENPACSIGKGQHVLPP